MCAARIFALATLLLGASRVFAGTTGLVAVSPTGPWMLHDLQAAHADIASYDPESGVAYVVATAAEERRLVGAGFAVATAEPDLAAGLRRLQGSPDLGLYHTYAEMVTDLESLQTHFPSLCKLEVLGQTLEGRDILALKVAANPQIEDPGKPDVLIVGCHHAREFMSVEVPLHLAHWLLENYGIGPFTTHLVDTRETWIVPMLNPDGHVFQENFQASPEWYPPGWRKNRRPNFDGTTGVDPNRNYGFLWGHDDLGSSPDGGDETFRGERAFSEAETQAMRLLVRRQRFVVSLSFHSFGRLWLYPWGYTDTALTDDQPLFAVLADSMVRSNGYRPGNAYQGTIYLTNGDLDDYMYGEITPQKPARTLAFTAELNSDGEGGFWPPDGLIAPTSAAMLPASLFALAVADNVGAALPPPPPILSAAQDPADRRHIHLAWTQPQDPSNPVDHYEVFEIAFTALDAPPAAAALAATGRMELGRSLPRPASGILALDVTADLAPLWDYAYVEARAPGGGWVTLHGDATRDASPTGRNQGHGLTGPIPGRRLHFALEGVTTPCFDLALRLEAHPDTPRAAHVGARLDLGATYSEERRVLDPDVHGTSYDIVATRGGIFAYGITAVDTQGQKTDSEVFFFVIPTVAVELADIELSQAGGRIALRWRSAATGPARFDAWTRPVGPGDLLADAATEWGHGGWTLAASLETAGSGPASLVWEAPGGDHAVLLQSHDADGDRVWGPWQVRLARRMRLEPPIPNPFNPSTTLEYELGRAADAQLAIFAVDGHRVRTLAAGHLAAGVRRVGWDGRDEAGRAVGSGLYWARLRADGQTAIQKLVLLR